MTKYILYGAGHIGITVMRYVGKERIELFCDEKKCGDCIEGVKVISPDKLGQQCGNNTVIIAVSDPVYIVQITKFLVKQNIEFLFWKDLVDSIIRDEGNSFNQDCKRESFLYSPDKEFIISGDRYGNAASIDSYFWQDLWAAKMIYHRRPEVHYDIGSRVDGFITHLLSFDQIVKQIDIRPLDVDVSGYGFVQADATNLNGIENESIKSISALCSLEHFGLGRYGDDLDPEGCFKAFRAIQRVLGRDGYAYISVPIGKEHLEFNAHRVFSPQTIIESFDKMELVEFSCCYCATIERDIDIHKYDSWLELGGRRVGLFCFRKN